MNPGGKKKECPCQKVPLFADNILMPSFWHPSWPSPEKNDSDPDTTVSWPKVYYLLLENKKE